MSQYETDRDTDDATLPFKEDLFKQVVGSFSPPLDAAAIERARERLMNDESPPQLNERGMPQLPDLDVMEQANDIVDAYLDGYE